MSLININAEKITPYLYSPEEYLYSPEKELDNSVVVNDFFDPFLEESDINHHKLVSPILDKMNEICSGKMAEIFLSLDKLVDRTDGGDADEASQSNCNSPTKYKYTSTKRFFRSDSDFWGDGFEFPIHNLTHSPSINKKVMSALDEIFFGSKLFKKQGENSYPEVQKKILETEKDWEEIQKNYDETFEAQMISLFSDAKELLDEKPKDKNKALYLRIVFYVGLVFGVLGKVVGQNIPSALGVGSSLAALIFMVRHYISSSFKQNERESNLKISIDAIRYLSNDHYVSLKDPVIPVEDISPLLCTDSGTNFRKLISSSSLDSNEHQHWFLEGEGCL